MIITYKDKDGERQASRCFCTNAHVAQKVPSFVPSWMVKVDKPFDSKRALNSAVRMGEVELAERLIDHFQLQVDKADVLKRTALNAELLCAVHNYGGTTGGASVHAAEWNWPRGNWFSVLSGPVICADSPCYSDTERKRHLEVAVLLIERGAYLSFCESGGDGQGYSAALHVRHERFMAAQRAIPHP